MTARRGRPPEALEQFRLAKSLAAGGERERAVACYRAALEHDPDFAEALINLGILHGQLGPAHADEAIRSLERGVELSPSSARAHYNLGVVLARRKDRVAQAIREFEAAVAIDPGHRNALYALAVQWSRKGDPRQAADYHQRYQLAMGRPAADPARSRAKPARERPPAARIVRPLPARPRLRIRFVRSS